MEAVNAMYFSLTTTSKFDKKKNNVGIFKNMVFEKIFFIIF